MSALNKCLNNPNRAAAKMVERDQASYDLHTANNTLQTVSTSC